MIKKWNEFMLERLGISDVTLIYTEIILSYLENIIDQSFQLNKLGKEKHDVVINKSAINNSTRDENKNLLSQLPIRNFIINFTVVNNDPDLEVEEEKFKTSGICYEFAKPNREVDSRTKKSGLIIDKSGNSIDARLGVSAFFSSNFDKSFDYVSFRVELESTISHELNHLFESYNRVSKKLDIHADIDPHIGVVNVKNPNPELISAELFDKWIEFTYLLYYSEPHEINAVSQESLSYISRGIELDKIPGWEIQNKLNTFNKADYYDEMLVLADGDQSKVELLKNDFAERFRKLLVNQGRLFNNIYHTKHDVDFILGSTFKSFIGKYSIIISKQGARLRKNILRLYSYAKD